MPSVDVNAPPAPPVSRSTRRLDLTLLFILLFGILLRCQYLDLPMAEAHRWREITNADIARNFAERSMNIFYPQVNWGGAHDPYVGMEFPLMHEPAHVLASRNKEAIEDIVHTFAVEAGATDPRALAQELCLIIEGAYVTRHVTGNKQTIEIARRIATQIIAKHCP